MVIGVYFAFEVTVTAVYVVLFTTCGFCAVKCQSLTTSSGDKINSAGSFPKHTRQSPNIAVDRIKIAYVAMFLYIARPNTLDY